MESKTKIHQRLNRLKPIINGGKEDYSEDDNIPKRRDVSNGPVEEAERLCEKKEGRFERVRGDIYVVYEESRGQNLDQLKNG